MMEPGTGPESNNNHWNVDNCAIKGLGFRVSSLEARPWSVICWLWGRTQPPSHMTQVFHLGQWFPAWAAYQQTQVQAATPEILTGLEWG